MGSVIKLRRSRPLALCDEPDGRVSVRLTTPAGETEVGLCVFHDHYGEAREYAEYVIGRCPEFYGPIVDQTGGDR